MELTPDIHLLPDQMVAVRDGARLATDVYLPARNGAPLPGPFPVILERTPYGKREVSRMERTAQDSRAMTRGEVATFFVRQGYAVVFQDVRGRGRSDGVFRKYLDEGPDGYDTVEWLARQVWCDGSVGTMGLSYAAHCQMALACLAPPALRCMIVDSGGFFNAFRSGIRQGGAFELRQATWAWNQARQSPEAAADSELRAALDGIDIRAWFSRMPWKPGHSPIARMPAYEDALFEQWRHGAFDGYWRRVGLWAEGFIDAIADVPTLLMGSWYDPYVRCMTSNYQALSATKEGPVHLVMGPWTHGQRSVSHAGEVDFGKKATLDGELARDYRHFRLAWFDRWMKPDGVGKTAMPAPVRLFVMGGGSGRINADGRLDHGGRWLEEESWPPPDVQTVPFHLHHDGRLDPKPPREEEAGLSFDFDPNRPVPTIGGNMSSGEPVMEAGAFDQTEREDMFACQAPYLPLASRHDVLVFQTAPLKFPVEVNGPIRARLWVSSSAIDTDFTIKLIDVYPPGNGRPHGFAMNLTDGILRMRYRHGWTRPEPMTPGEICEIEIEATATANLFAAGHRIRLDISSSNFPKFDVNPNTGAPEGTSGPVRVATNSVWLDGSHPSHLLLPLRAG